MASVVAPFQSCVSMSHSTSVRPNLASSALSVALVFPYGGRNSLGAGAPPAWMAVCVWEISLSICVVVSDTMSAWSQVWLPTHMPAATSAATSDGLLAAFWPMLNIVARTPAAVSADSNGVVPLAFGPSSYVRPTYPPQVAACDGNAFAVTASTAPAASTPAARTVTDRRVGRDLPSAMASPGIRSMCTYQPRSACRNPCPTATLTADPSAQHDRGQSQAQ